MNLTERYTVLEEIGRGSMGLVYRARDEQTGEDVAVKRLNPNALLDDEHLLERFKREGEVLRRLNHPNIVNLIDAFDDGQKYHLVMQYVDGSDLRAYLREQDVTIEQVLNYAIDIADALTRAHRLSIIHRDIKPANVMVASDGSVLLTDFGVARLSEGEYASLTTESSVVGTLAYLSPEGFEGAEADPRTDIWAFGVLLYELLTGKLPFRGDNMADLIRAVIHEPVPDLEALVPNAPVALLDLIYRMLEKNPAERIPSVRVVGSELEAILEHTASPSEVIRRRSDGPDGASLFDAPTPTTTESRHNLPVQTTAFVGRESELEELTNLITDSDVRLVTILGPGGIGKSRLALELAEDLLKKFLHGVYFVELASIHETDGIVSEIGDALGYPFQQDGRSPLEQITSYLREKQTLLLIDNFEHLLDGAGIITEILQHAPEVQVVVTSRQRLNQSGESVFQLSGLDVPDSANADEAMQYSAVKLFMQSARRAQPTFTLATEDLPAASAICHMVDGLPLGIMLAASWLDTLSLPEIAQEIEKSIDFLEHDMSDLPERHQSIRAVFDYSLQLLSDAERTIFMKLSVFRGGFTREAVQNLTGGESAGAAIAGEQVPAAARHRIRAL